MTRSTSRRLRPSVQLSYGLGWSAEAVVTATVNSFAMFYYNQVLGMPATLAGLALTISILLDAFIDPLIGSISDRTHSRLGRRHPFLFTAALPIAAALFALFHPPSLGSGSALFGWFVGAIIVLRVSVSLFHVPLLALGGELSDDYSERSRIMASAALVGAVVTAVATFLALSVFLKATPRYPQGLMNPRGYDGLSITVAAMALVGILVCAGGTLRRLPFLPQPRGGKAGFRPEHFVADLGMVLCNRNYLFLMLGLFVLSFIIGVRNSLTVYANTYFWALTSEDMRWFSIWNLAAVAICLPFTATLHDRIGKRATLVSSILIAGVLVAAPVAMKLFGVFPVKGQWAWLPLQILFTAAATAVLAVLYATAMSALADIADENELRFGVRQEGVLYSTRTFLGKVDTAVGSFVAGGLIDALGIHPGMTPGQVSPHSVALLGWVFGPAAMIPAALTAVCYAQFTISRQAHGVTRQALALRAGSAGPP